MAKYEVTVVRKQEAICDVIVEAKSSRDAINIALDKASDYSYDTIDSEYDTCECALIEED